MLSKKQLQDICLLHSQGTCRYLDSDDADHTKWCCLKHNSIKKKTIDAGVSAFVTECKSKGLDPVKQNNFIGDNCSGYPFLKHLEQGYDKDN
jgi:hypothetical protein